MNKQDAISHLYELWQTGEIPNNFDENHSDYENAIIYTIKNGQFNYEQFMADKAIIKFGMWQVESDALVAKEGHDYIIADNRFWETRDYNGHLVWDWLIHLVEKSWINKNNVKDLNNAFFFCQDYFKKFKPSSIPYVSTAQTLYIQQQLLDIDEVLLKSENTNELEIRDNDSMNQYYEMMNNIKYL